MLNDNRLDLITPEDLERLVSNGIQESRSLEYKEYLPGTADEDKREFLADVSAFANSSGGDLLFGAVEKRDETGRPTGTVDRIVGVAIDNLDQTIQRLDLILRDGVAPRMAGIQFKAVAGFQHGPALIIRIPRSWAAPHMVTFKNLARFYTRQGAGKHQLDITELRTAFLSSRSAAERAEEFRLGRLGRLISGDSPVPLSSERLLIVHAIPEGSLFGSQSVDLRKAKNEYLDLRPMASSGWSARFNVDGLISTSGYYREDRTQTGFLQLHHNGVFESVYSDIYFDQPGFVAGIGSEDVFNVIVDFAERIQRIYQKLEVAPPVAILISFTKMRGAVLHVSRRGSNSAFDRDTVLLPDVSITDFDGSSKEMLRPAMDRLWQASGYERCFLYPDSASSE